MFRIKWKTERQGKITFSDKAVPAESKQPSTDGSSIQHQPPEGTVSVTPSPGGNTSHEHEPKDPYNR